MIDQNTVSIIMACYNSEKTLEKAIDSILAQTYDNWVMICCDDGSSDRTVEILQDYQKRYPDKFVVLQNETNRKLPYSLNRCLREVKTELVARMDADDWCMPERLEKQVAFLREHLGTIIRYREPTKESMTRQNAFSHPTIMTYKRVYDALGGYSEDPMAIRVEDVDLWCRFLAAGFKGYNMPDLLYVYLDDQAAIKKRTLRARFNSSVTRFRGYKLMGIRGWRRYKPFLNVLRAFVPAKIYQYIHLRRYQKKKEAAQK